MDMEIGEYCVEMAFIEVERAVERVAVLCELFTTADGPTVGVRLRIQKLKV